MNTITTTNFNFPNQKSVYRGKVREVYNINDELLVMIATDRLSAFDVVMPKGIPYKGQILNQIATKFMELTKDIVPNWLIATPDPNVAVGYLCNPFKVEMVIRGYLSGHAAREYVLGKRTICGVAMEEGLKENDKFPIPLITPTTKFTPALIQNLKDGFPELSQKLARIQAIEFSIGGKSLTKTEQQILEPLYGWRGLTVDALRKRLEGTKDEFEKSTLAFETFYPGLAEIRPKLDQIYKSTGRVPALPETGSQDVEQAARQRFNSYEPDKYNYGYDDKGFYRERK
jgi:hypothetical protein